MSNKAQIVSITNYYNELSDLERLMFNQEDWLKEVVKESKRTYTKWNKPQKEDSKTRAIKAFLGEQK